VFGYSDKKKGKPTEPSSYKPVTTSSVFCKLFEIIVFGEIYNKCKMPRRQFCFHKGLVFTNILHLLANILFESHHLRESFVLAQYDVRIAFYSGIHAQILVETRKQDMCSSILRSLSGMYKNLKF